MRTLVIAAPSSGSGKTTIATGIMGALRAAGHRVAPFKVGPDYIDPGYHALAAGRIGRNLDPVMVGRERLVPLLAHGCDGCDIAVVEGVMGLFDGRIDPSGSPTGPAAGSTADVAEALGAPVVLVVDGRGQSQSIGALVQGFATFAPQVRVAAVILNRVGSARHEAVLRQACEAVGVPVVGSVPRTAALSVPSRHLGLVTATEHGSEADEAVAAMTALATRHIDLDALVRIADTARTPPGEPWAPPTPDREPSPRAAGDPPISTAGDPPTLAVAGGPAFTFGYAEQREIIEAAGGRVVVFDPRTETLPPAAAALVIGGGFPELHAPDLAANVALLGEIAALVTAGAPVHAECAGLLYLAATLDGHAMAGVLDVDTRFGDRLTLGYRDAVALTDSVMFDAGTRVTGHEFHRTAVVRESDGPSAWGWRRDDGADAPTRAVREGYVAAGGAVHASYLHTHPVAIAAGLGRLVAAAARVGAPR